MVYEALKAGDLAIRAFLLRNGHLFGPGEANEVVMIMALAAATVDEDALVIWIAENTSPREDRSH